MAKPHERGPSLLNRRPGWYLPHAVLCSGVGMRQVCESLPPCPGAAHKGDTQGAGGEGQPHSRVLGHEGPQPSSQSGKLLTNIPSGFPSLCLDLMVEGRGGCQVKTP